ncbi:hypothetical protein [Thermodesulfobacterium thermophilum]|uniref:hypothetical protein n=1 Tax=Thermodesulfobacterium thermophilum TaxID=886 RepID=UPI001B7FB1C3|nr:hypothetical protein [Thermodesulfobacterium thermophilum]
MMKMILLKVLFFCITLTLFSSIVVAEVDCKTECVEWETKEECKIVGPDSESKICELRTVCKRYEKRCKEPMLKSDKNGSDKKSE